MQGSALKTRENGTCDVQNKLVVERDDNTPPIEFLAPRQDEKRPQRRAGFSNESD